MAAYVILDVRITDPETYEEYKKVSGATLTEFGGEFVVRGGPHEVLEGDWDPARIVVLRFPSLERAKAWYGSETYREPKAMRTRASVSKMVVVDGCD